ncbi:uncharacterized protein LOC105703665 [Orussus abietinus]|uniref:uncharacterized protein LOC105703665 n=1 Tax=Orussus abietinus TaxID=222816 RepID=UPI00062522CF|nr:uncharacterized protein LOC105703665 [Orussus abietinus]XP_012287626.1 uncharacterized protein LOC105703665 [Orussus abietinus]
MMNMWKVRELMDKATNVVMNYTETEAKVREATNDDAWGPTGAMMQELAQATFTYEQFPDVMSMLWKRMLQENKRNWRRTYKSLLLLNYLVRNGSERVVTSSREHIYDLRSLENYTYIDEFGKDQGINIRHKVRELIDFIQDDDKLREERKKAKKNKDKYVGMSSEAMGMRFGAGDRWTDNPKWTKPSPDNYNDWDRDSRGRGFEDANNSDDGEREDSDNEGHPSPRRGGREYRDTAESIDRIGKTSQPSTPANTSPARIARAIKKVDLGAAANYGKDQLNEGTPTKSGNLMSSPVKQPQKSKNDILNDIFNSQNENNDAPATDNDDYDDFNPRANNYTPVQTQNVTAEFGDFASAFGTGARTNDNGDEFADFTSAFNSGVNISPAPQAQISLMGATIPSIGNPLAANMASSTLIGSQHPTVTSPPANLASSNLLTPSNNATGNIFSPLPPQGLNMNNQPQSLNSSNNNQALSNADLLTDLDGFNSMPTIPTLGQANNVNANLFGIASSTSNPVDFNTDGRPEEEMDTSSLAASRLLDSISVIKSEAELLRVKSMITDYSRHLMGPMTPQRYAGVDGEPDVDAILYGRVLEAVVERFDPKWPLAGCEVDPVVKNLFVVEGANCVLFNEALLVLTDALKRFEDRKIVHSVVAILEELVKSDAPFSALVNACHGGDVELVGKCGSDEVEELTKSRDRDDMKPMIILKNGVSSGLQKAIAEQSWQDTIRVLASLPGRVANKLQRNTPDAFVPEEYARILSFHISRAVVFMAEGLSKVKIHPDLGKLSTLMSKLILSTNASYYSSLVEVFSELCAKDSSEPRFLVRDILLNLERPSVEPVAVLFLKNHRIDGIAGMICELLKNSNWKYALTVRIPMMSYYEDDTLIENLVQCLKTDKEVILEVVSKLLDTWGNRSALKHTTFNQHVYVTKLIILSMRNLKSSLRDSELATLKRSLLDGVPSHLESIDPIIRYLGMITGEILVDMLNESKDAPKLTFEYDQVTPEIAKLLEDLKTLGTKGGTLDNEGDLCFGHLEFSTIGYKKIYELGVQCKIIKDSEDEQSSSGSEVVAVKGVGGKLAGGESSAMKPVVRTQSTKEDSEEQEFDEDDLDSDDEAVPKDISIYEVRVLENKRPFYLRDLLDTLTGSTSDTNSVIFSACLENAEEMITSQLPNDDASFAVELLAVLSTLEDRVYVENFLDLVLRSCVAIVKVYPKETAEFLCKEFHAEMTSHPVRQKVFFLRILEEAARSLSEVQVEADPEETSSPGKQEQKPPAKSISLLIDSSSFRTHEVLFDDDDLFQVFRSEDSKSDWRNVVQKRIDSNTRRFASSTKIVKCSVNRFGEVASSFFYPLVFGLDKRGGFGFLVPIRYEDQENILLVSFLNTLSTIVVAARNCSRAAKMGRELLELAWTLRYHGQSRVRLAVIRNAASVLVSVPSDIVAQEMLDLVFEFKAWLLDVTRNTFKGDPDDECKRVGRNVVAMIDSLFVDLLKS